MKNPAVQVGRVSSGCSGVKHRALRLAKAFRQKLIEDLARRPLPQQ
jgi:hypothetical protein